MARPARNGVGRASRDGEKSRATQDPMLPQHAPAPAGGHGGHHGWTRIKGGLHIKTAGDSGRSGIHPIRFFKVIWKSSCTLSSIVNILWPFVIAAIVIHYTREGQHVLKFSLAYIAMVPCANLIGFAGQELARKLPHMIGILIETTQVPPPTHTLLSGRSVVEIVLFMVLLVAKHGLGLAIPAIFNKSLVGGELTAEDLSQRTVSLSRIIAILLLVSYVVFVFFQMRSHHGIYDAVFEHDESRDEDAHKDIHKEKLTLTECIFALAVSVALVTFIAIALVHEIHFIVTEQGVSDPFMGLILVPLVEKAAEHLTAIDEAWDNQVNFALSHCIGATIQTAMLNAPLVVIVGWGLQLPMDFSFEIFDVAMLIISIITVGNFLRDQKSDYLEGFLCVIVYIAIAVAAAFYPNPIEVTQAHH
ncbi:hypothetical protein SLS62_005998 [Diatrype stigma]|uniref:Sodium/calcium exchanger membrane region domain-containing protein n=1 Tax=Diatrype stigma TaxID=117547 RepID=A0AAN9UN85_9PEZI